jgi:hypothetical protein
MRSDEGFAAVPRIAALRGGSREVIQSTLAEFAALGLRRGLRVAGMIEEVTDCSRGDCRSLALRDLTTGDLISISQDLGKGSEACNLDPAGLAAACAAVERAIEGGADFVILSKFGKLEVAHSGLLDAFRAAIIADLPIVTAVAPSHAEAWTDFAGALFTYVEPDMSRLDAWWWAAHDGAAAIAAE